MHHIRNGSLQDSRNTTRHLDALRILAAGSVVVLHYSDYVKDSSVGRFVYEHTTHFNMFVDMFFVVSGFVIASQYLTKVGDIPSIGRFVSRRLARVYPLHLATLAFYLAISLAIYLGLVRSGNAARYPLSDVPAQLLLLHAFCGERLTFNFPSWSLSAELFCYLAFPAIALLVSGRKALILVLIVVPVLANTIYAMLTGIGPWAEWINRGGAFRALPGFNIGVACYLYRNQISRWRYVPGALTVGLAAFILFGWLLPDMAALVSIYAITVLAIQCDLIRITTILIRSGLDRAADYTYSSYMLHIPVATIVLTFGAHYLATTPEEKLALVPIAIIILAAASIASFHLFETPLRRYLNSISDRHFSLRSPMATIPPPERV